MIEEDVWIGFGAIILAGAHLGRGCVVGAGTIVNKEVPPYSIVVGPTAKIIKKKFTIEQILEHEKHYTQLTNVLVVKNWNLMRKSISRALQFLVQVKIMNLIEQK